MVEGNGRGAGRSKCSFKMPMRGVFIYETRRRILAIIGQGSHLRSVHFGDVWVYTTALPAEGVGERDTFNNSTEVFGT